MITKAELKCLTSYKQSKYRNAEKIFVVEGAKMYAELIASDFDIVAIYATDNSFRCGSVPFWEISNKDLERISLLKTPNKVYCVVRQRKAKLAKTQNLLTLALDGISDPGNMGTIIRLAEWFGIKNIICSTDCVDVFNHKVVQATMGSIFRINVCYVLLYEWLQNLPDNFPVYGTLVENGENIYQSDLSNEGIIVIGSESFGISNKVKDLINRPLTVPRFSIDNQNPESLNASIATSIVLSEFCRKKLFV